MQSSPSRDAAPPVFGQRQDTPTDTQITTVNTRQSASSRSLEPATNSLVHYRPSSTSQPRPTPAFPTPHIRARQRRPHTIHIVSYPAGYVPTELRSILPPGHSDPSNAPQKSKHARKRASKGKTAPTKRKRQACQPHHTLADSPSTKARVLDKLRSVLFPPSTSLTPKEQQTPQRRITVTTRPARPNSFLSFSRRLSATSSLPPDISPPILDVEPVHSQPRPSQQAALLPDRSTPAPTMAPPAQLASDRTHAAGYPFADTTRTIRRKTSLPKVSARRKVVPRLPVSIDHPISSVGGMALDILFAEPYVFLRGFDHNRLSNRERSSGYDIAPPILRGKMRLVVAKDTKIRGITIRLQNRAATDWPQTCVDGLKSDYEENDILRSQTQTVFNAIHGQWDGSYGNMCEYELKHQAEDTFGAILHRLAQGPHGLSDSASIRSGITKEIKGFALDRVQARSFEKSDSPLVHPTQAKGYKIFPAGTYEYNFEFPIDHHQVETINVPHGSVKWHVEAVVERPGTFKANLHGKKEVSIVRVPDLLSLETVDPIALARPWEDQMYYEVCISGKSFPIGGKIPIAFKITPLAKVQVHKIKVFVNETIEYKASHKSLSRKETRNKVLLFEKAAGQPISPRFRNSDFCFVSGGEENGMSDEARRTDARVSNMLGDLECGNTAFWTSTELEMNVGIPTCAQMAHDSKIMLYPDSSWRNAHVTHWIKVQLRVSRIDPDDTEGKRRRHYEISIDSPMTILSCAANQGNLSLPQYTGRDVGTTGNTRGFQCGCTDSSYSADVRQSIPLSLRDTPPSFFETAYTTQPANHISRVSPSSSDDSIVYTPSTSDGGDEQTAPAPAPTSAPAPERARTDQRPSAPARPIHLIRVPSFAPPAFDDDNSPPVHADVLSPPPQYEAIVGSPSVDGLADYFSRLADYDDNDTHTGSAALDESSDSDSESLPTRIASRTGRVNVSNPRTPGGARHGPSRSMDIQRPTTNFQLQLPTTVRRGVRE